MMFKETSFVDVRVTKVIPKGLISSTIPKASSRRSVKKSKENTTFSPIVPIGSPIVDIYDG